MQQVYGLWDRALRKPARPGAVDLSPVALKA